MEKNEKNKRMEDYKFAGKLGGGRAKRREYAVSLRKDKRAQKLDKRRDMQEFNARVEEFTQTDFGQAIVNLRPIIENDADPAAQHEALVELRQFLANNKTLPIQATINSGVLPKLVDMLGWDNSETQYEAAWVLTNVSSGERHQTLAVVEVDAIVPLCNLLLSDVVKVKDQACWCLGNIAGDGPHLRDQLIECGALDQCIIMLRDEDNLDLLRNVSWTLSNFFRWRNPPPPVEKMTDALHVLADRIVTQDDEVLANVSWSVCYIAEAQEEFLNPICDTFGQTFIDILSLRSHNAQLPALRALGSITAGEDEQTQMVIDLGLLPLCHNLFKSKKANVRKDACWAVSNVCAGSPPQIDCVIHERLVDPIIELCHNDPVGKVRQDAAWCLCNLASRGEMRHRDYVIDNDGVRAISSVFNIGMDTKALKVFLEAFMNLLDRGADLADVAQTDNLVATVLEETQCVDKFQCLLDHRDEAISTVVDKLIDTYFYEDDDVEDIAPELGDGRYKFSAGEYDGDFNI